MKLNFNEGIQIFALHEAMASLNQQLAFKKKLKKKNKTKKTRHSSPLHRRWLFKSMIQLLVTKPTGCERQQLKVNWWMTELSQLNQISWNHRRCVTSHEFHGTNEMLILPMIRPMNEFRRLLCTGDVVLLTSGEIYSGFHSSVIANIQKRKTQWWGLSPWRGRWTCW